MGDYGPGEHPNARAALVPFARGYDPRRQVGAPSLGRQITAHMNELGREDDTGQAVYSEADLRAIARDPRAPHARVIAAQEVLRARLDGFDKIGRVPQAANSIDRIMDRTEGRPAQTVHVTHSARGPQDVELEIVEVLVESPELLHTPAVQLIIIQAARESATLRARLRPMIEERAPEMVAALEPVETTARVIESSPQDTAEAVANEIAVRDLNAEAGRTEAPTTAPAAASPALEWPAEWTGAGVVARSEP